MLRSLLLGSCQQRLVFVRHYAAKKPKKVTKSKKSLNKLGECETKIVFNADAKETSPDLKDLAEFLSRCLERGGVPAELNSEFGKDAIAAQQEKADNSGICYTITLKESTLADGILELQDRRTTLGEKVHVSMLKRYIMKLVQPE